MTEQQPTSSPPPGAHPLWGRQTGAAPPNPPKSSPGLLSEVKGLGGEPLDPLSHKLMRGVRFLSLLLLLVVANSFLNGEDSPLELNPVAVAAEKVEKASGGRFYLYIVYSSPAIPEPIVASGGGAANERTDRSRISLEMNNPLTGGTMHLIQIQDGEIEYTGGDIVEDKLPPGKEWVRVDESEAEEDETPLSIEESLQMLGSSGKVKLVGRESINGKMTRRYRSDIRLGDLIDFLREQDKDKEADAYERIEGLAPTQISAEGWVDRKQLLRRLRMVMPMPGEPGEPPVTVDMRIDLFDYGARPNIQLPDPDRVVEGPLDEAPASGSIS